MEWKQDIRRWTNYNDPTPKSGPIIVTHDPKTGPIMKTLNQKTGPIIMTLLKKWGNKIPSTASR
jgi:hypothetical protein